MDKYLRKIWLIAFLPATLIAGEIPYSITFEGLDDSKTLKELRSISQLVALKKKPPSSINALRFRAESDVPDMIKALHAQGYLEAQIDVQIKEQFPDYSVGVTIDPGMRYRIEEFKVHLRGNSLEENIDVSQIHSLKKLGIRIGDPYQTKNILDSELAALNILSECGYPHAEISSREIVADGNIKKVKIALIIKTGPIAQFGITTIDGNSSVRPQLINQQIQWEENEHYDSRLVDETQKALMDTGLFSSVYITHPETLDENTDDKPPMKIDVSETKHKSISLGASFQTTYGPGVTFGWENRNVGGMGRRLMLQADIAQRSHSGIASYLIPNFHKMGQNYIIQAQADHESITTYKQRSYSLMQRFSKQTGKNIFFSLGAKFEYIMVSSSVDNGNFLLTEVPFFIRWTNVKDFLNPISGFRLELRGTPAVNIKDATDYYYSQNLTFCSYLPLIGEQWLTLAQKFTIGTIVSNGLNAIPVPKRLFGGSEDNLRGYKYLTVSPLNEKGKPIGGRSAFFYSVEPRFRISESFGIVPFFDIGNVYKETIPSFEGKWRKSVGIGARYFSFIGPLRMDLAFPLDRREGIDPDWWIFASLGQTF